MKKLTIAVTLSFLFISAYAQSCIPDSIAFTTQAEIDNFQANYPGCTEIEGDVWIEGQDITNLNGLHVLASIGGYLDIRNNPLLTNVTGLDNITSIGGFLGFSGNSSLTSLSGLNNLTSIGGFFGFVLNNSISSLSGLENVTSIGGNIVIRGNESLINLSGLDNVISVQGSIVIRQHPALTSLTGLDNIDPGSIINLWILDNSSLSDCAVQSICDYLLSPGGSVDIDNNAQNCNSQLELEEACEYIQITEVALQENLSIYPNPAKKELNIAGDGYTIQEVTIYTLTGQQVNQERPVDGTIDISSLHTGMYIVELISEDSKVRQKLLVE